MTRPRNVLMLYGRRHHLKLCEKTLTWRNLWHRFSRQLLQVYGKLKQINAPNWPDYVLSRVYRAFGTLFPTKIELEVTSNYEQNFSQFAMLIGKFENDNLTEAKEAMNATHQSAVGNEKKWNWLGAVSGCTHS